MGILCVYNNPLFASRQICDRSPDNNLSAKTKWQNGVTQGAVYSHLASYRKSSSFVLIMFTEIKRDVALNLKYA